jgi:hypothetical protein
MATIPTIQTSRKEDVEPTFAELKTFALDEIRRGRVPEFDPIVEEF